MNHKSKIQQLVDGSLILICSNLIIKAANFFLLPLYTKYLTPTDLGISDTITGFTAFLYPLLILAFDSAFSAFYFDSDAPLHRKKVFSTVEITMIATSMIAVILLFFSKQASYLLFHSEQYSAVIKLALISVILNLWYTPLSIQIRLENRMRLLAVINLITSLSMLFFNILFVSFLQLNYLALIVSMLLVQLLSVIIYSCNSKQSISLSLWDSKLFKKMLRYALPLVPMLVSNWILSLSDRYIILYYMGPASVGIYGIASRFVTVLNVITTSISTSYVSFAFSSVHEKNAKENANKVLNTVFVILLSLCFTISVFSKELVAIMTETQYFEAYKLVAPLMLGQVCYCVTTIIGYGIAFAKKSSYFLFATLSGTIINVISNIIFIPMYGNYAAALTTFAGYFIMMITTYYLAQKVYPCLYRIKTISVLIIIMLVLCLNITHLRIMIKIILWGIGVGVIVLLFKQTFKSLIIFLGKYIRDFMQGIGRRL